MNWFLSLVLTVLIGFVASPSFAFILIDKDYRLSDPRNTNVNVATGSCVGNGISDDDLKAAITTVLERFWNTVAESRLRLKTGSAVSRSITGFAEPGEILVGCEAMGMSGPSGVAYPSNDLGSAVVVLNATTFTPGNYHPDALINVLAHEMGHAIGLDHSEDPASIMTYSDNDWGFRPAFLSQDDKDGVIYLYPNKSAVLGLFGGCGAIAAAGESTNRSATMDLGIFLLAVLLTWALLRRARRWR
jgi:hypothetical protein